MPTTLDELELPGRLDFGRVRLDLRGHGVRVLLALHSR